jgi:predicted ATPase with chaperone activity
MTAVIGIVYIMLLIGPPAEGKSLLAGALPDILLRLPNLEKVQQKRISSAY